MNPSESIKPDLVLPLLGLISLAIIGGILVYRRLAKRNCPDEWRNQPGKGADNTFEDYESHFKSPYPGL